MCLNIGTPKNINFSFETNRKLMALGVPILKHIRVFQQIVRILSNGIMKLQPSLDISKSVPNYWARLFKTNDVVS